MATTIPLDDDPVESLHERIAALADRLAPIERQVAQYLLDHPQVAAEASAAEIGRAIGTSDASVVRTVKALGYPGLRELRRERVRALASYGNPEPMLERRLGKIEVGEEDELVHVAEDTVRVIKALRNHVTPVKWRALVDAARSAERIVCFGVGTARTAAEYLSLQLLRSGVSSVAIGSTGFQLADDLISVTERDLVVVFAPLRRFIETDTVLERATAVGASSVVVSETLGLAYRDAATLTIATPRTTVGTASEIVSSLILGHALVLALAAQDAATAVTATRTLDRLRARLSGGEPLAPS